MCNLDRNSVEPTSDYKTNWSTIRDHITDPSHRPATFMRLQAGGIISSSSRNVSAANYPGIAYRDQTVGTLSLMRVPRRIGFRSGGWR
jgi:hypothetical protein